MSVEPSPTRTSELPWYRQVNRDQWRAFWATFLGWVLDGFDFTILTFILIDIQNSFTIDRALAGALGTVTLLMRLVGGAAAGTAADRWGRRLPLMLSILWFSLFAGLSGFSTSYAMLFAFRALFGIGMGGEWAAGMPLVLEHWPAHLRGIASGLLQGGYSWGFILSAMVYTFIYPALEPYGEIAWRAMFWLGIVPALLVLWIRKNVPESPVWLERRKHMTERKTPDGVSLWRIFKPDLILTTAQASVLIGSFMFSYYSISFWYATYLIERGLTTLPFLIALNVGGILGAYVWGRASEGRVGRRGAASIAALVGITMVPLYLYVDDTRLLFVGAALMGLFGAGMWGVIPTYLSERFPTAARSVGAGFCYHAGAALGSMTPFVVGAFQDRGWALPDAMATCIVAALLLSTTMLWLGPETRGRQFLAIDDEG
ncbi:MAG TPA: MFS transporter [Thermoanaerobaculia bacterium]|nr:MFS transporter [Thermoanaerobaculia bacterium]